MERGNELITLLEAAGLLGISKSTLWRIIRGGELPVVKIAERSTRIKRSDLDAYVMRRYETKKPQNR